MAIENNLPVIFDVATQTEDGLMSHNDKIKLDNMGENLDNKVSKDEKITSSQLDISSDDVKIKLENLSEEVINAMTGETQIEYTAIANKSITGDKLVDNAVSIDKMDKRFLLGNVVSPRPINFTIADRVVSINIPKGSLLMLDAITRRDIVVGSAEADVTINLNLPEEYDGLNYIVSTPSKEMKLYNYRTSNTISSTNSIVALLYLSTEYDPAIVMHGSYTINGLSQGIGTDSAALMGNGKIVFDKSTGIIDFTEIPALYLVTGGVFNRIIQDQASIRLSDYSEDSIYVLYWNNATQALETNRADAANEDTDICKIALIKDGIIIPFVDTKIFYSKPYIESPYYTESFEYINNIILSSKEKIDIIFDGERKIKIPEETSVCLNQQTLEVENTECYYEDKMGLHYMLFDLDNHIISCKHSSREDDTSVKNIVIGALWVGSDDIIVSGNFQYTIDGKTSYEDDLMNAELDIEQLQNNIISNIEENAILAGDEIYMIDGEELPVYESSMLINSVEGIKPVISYNKNNTIPRTVFFNDDILLDNTMGDTVSLSAYDKYNTHSYIKKDIKIKKTNQDSKANQTIKIMCIGDDLINDGTAFNIKKKLTSLDVTAEMIGTMDNSNVYGEGRSGWFYSTFLGASGRGKEEGKINPQVTKGSSSILLNPFMRIANADDKANNPNNCFRATGAYNEKNYYNDPDANGSFYIFDFANYLEVQGIENPDIIIIALKPELINIFTEDIVSTNMLYMKQLIAGIRKALPDTYIGIVPQYGACTVYSDMWEVTSKMITETITYVDGLKDDKIKVISAWLHMNREFGTKFVQNSENKQLYEEAVVDQFENVLSDNAKIELANAITAFIMNI